jgi:hypothetical protein
MGRRLALLIATYDYQDSGLRRLVSPGQDAQALAEVLADPDIAGFEVEMLVNEPYHRVGEAVGEFYRDCRRDDLTLLYFTGHGLKDDDGRLYLAMANTRRDGLLFTALAAEQIDQAMSASRSQRQVLILDCCYSGAFPPGRLAKASDDVYTLRHFHGRGRTVLTASDATQYAFEGDRLHGEASQSVFTQWLVTGLRDGSADLDGDGDITLDELYSYVYEQVVAQSPQQRPKKQDNVEGHTVIARNINWSLPLHVRDALVSPIAADRLRALDGLDGLYRIGNDHVRGQVLAEIGLLAGDDSREVASAAADWLGSASAGQSAATDAVPRIGAPHRPAVPPDEPAPRSSEQGGWPTLEKWVAMARDWYAEIGSALLAGVSWLLGVNICLPMMAVVLGGLLRLERAAGTRRLVGAGGLLAVTPVVILALVSPMPQLSHAWLLAAEEVVFGLAVCLAWVNLMREEIMPLRLWAVRDPLTIVTTVLGLAVPTGLILALGAPAELLLLVAPSIGVICAQGYLRIGFLLGWTVGVGAVFFSAVLQRNSVLPAGAAGLPAALVELPGMVVLGCATAALVVATGVSYLQLPVGDTPVAEPAHSGTAAE